MFLRLRTSPEKAVRGDEVMTPGIDYDSKVTFVAFRSGVIVLHTSGGTHWASVGERAYHGAQFIVFAVEEYAEKENGWYSLKVSELIEFAPRKGGKR